MCLSALVRDLRLAHPQYPVSVTGHYAGVFWHHNPHIKEVPAAGAQLVQLEYLEGIKAAGRGSKRHFLSWFHHDFSQKTGLDVPVTAPKGDIHLSRAEKQLPAGLPGRYWLVVAGGKLDMTAKVWRPDHWQAVVDHLKALGVPCVQAGANHRQHFHPALKNCLSRVGRTDERELFRLIYHCEGVLCGVTAAMHVAAVFDKPCVVVAGGREEPWWEAYSNCFYPEAFGPGCPPVRVEHTFLHTVGLLDCCQGRGCWKDRTVPVAHTDHSDPKRRDRLCKRPVRAGAYPEPECLSLITPEHVVEAAMNYYEKGVLPPIGPTRGTYRPVLAPPDEPPALRRLVATLPVEVAPPTALAEGLRIMDHPYLGGKVTVCVLGHGDHLGLLRRCLESILGTVPRERMELRLSLNQPSQAVLRWAMDMGGGVLDVLNTCDAPRRKYGAMRKLFHDPDSPLTTGYVLWFDDDSHAVEPTWLEQLCRCIVANHGQGCRLYGQAFYHDLAAYRGAGRRPEKWFQAAPWWRNQWLHMGGALNRVGPNGAVIPFVTGGFWALGVDALRAGDVPDARLDHNGGDICIGAQVHQAGFKVMNFGHNKRPVAWSDAPPRGDSYRGPKDRKPFPWSDVT